MAKKNTEEGAMTTGGYAIETFHIKGVIDLLVHSGQTIDPLNSFAKSLKEISGKKKKTDADYEAMARIEWNAGLYLNEKEQPIMPGVCIEAMLVSAAKVDRLGKDATCGIMVPEDALIIHDGPKTLAGLRDNPRFRDARAVKIGMARVIRTRPKFPVWEMEFDVHYDTGIFNRDKIQRLMEIAGTRIGMGDFRPRFGRFEIA